jgi:hypothetical protein
LPTSLKEFIRRERNEETSGSTLFFLEHMANRWVCARQHGRL